MNFILYQNSFEYPFRKYQIPKRNKIIIFSILFIIFIPLISKESQIVKIKVNKKDNVKIINNNYIPNPDAIYVNGQYIGSNIDTITIDDIEDEINLEWESKLTTCKYMFSELSNIIEIDLSNFDSSDSTDMQYMFYKCTSLKIINLRDLNTEKVTSMCNMFANCSSLTSIDVTHFKTSKVTEMDYMFYACYSLESLDLSNFDTSSNSYVSKMFMDCFKLKYLNLKGFKTEKIRNFNYMFNNCSSLKSLDLSSFDTSLGESSDYMFYGCVSLTSLDISNFNTVNNYDMSFMFAECKNLGYLNFKSVCEPEYSDYLLINNILDNTPHNMVMCFTISKANKLNNIFIKKNCELLYCNEDWKDKQNKVNGETGVCMEDCSGEFLYQYLNRCYKKCPEGTDDYNIQFICEDIIIEMEDDSEIENEVNFEEEEFEDKDNYYNIIISSSNKIMKEKETNKFESNSRQEREEQENNIYEKEEKEKNIDEYSEESEIDEENEIPNESEKNDIKISILTDNYYNTNEDISKTTNVLKTSSNIESINNCNISSFFNKECKIITQTKEQKKELAIDILTKIQDKSLDNIISSLVNEEKNLIIEDEEEIYSIGTLENQNLNESKTLIDLSDCEKELKRVYNISNDEKVLIFKIEKFIPGYKIPIIGYELFSQNGEINLDLNYCMNIKTNTYISINIDEKEIYKYNPNDEYYNSRCNQFTTDNGTDITLYDRQNEYNKNNMSLCEINCEYQGYDVNNKIAKCKCNIKNIKSFFENKDVLLNEFKSIKKIMNIYLLKCYKSVFSIKGLKNNIGNYTILSLFLISIIFIIYFYIKGESFFIHQVESLIKIKRIKIFKKHKSKLKKEIIIVKKNNDKIESQNNLLQIDDDNNLNINNFLTLNEIDDNKINLNKNKIKKTKINRKSEIKEENDIKLNDYEINSLSYEEALKYNKRTFFESYFSLIRTKQILCFTFFNKSDYNSRPIKIILFLLSFIIFRFLLFNKCFILYRFNNA